MLDSNLKEVASVVFAAGKGTRMTGYEGNKTLLPLIPGSGPFEGQRPLLLEVLENLPPGPGAIVVHHRADEVKEATRDYSVSYLLQPATNGTGGALLAAQPFLESAPQDTVIITMGDVPLIRPETYLELLHQLSQHSFVLLAFAPRDKAQYGMLEMEGDRVARIVEWKYWRAYPSELQSRLRLCNAGVYAADRRKLLIYMEKLAAEPHRVQKKLGGEWVTIEEYFLTDLVEMFNRDGVSIGVVIADEEEITGVDTPEALKRVQEQYARRRGTG